jgi:bifunctional non-homologous end joining protein LigD
MQDPVPTILSRPDKLLWPEEGVTKRLYLEYLDAVSGHMLPWLRDRPLTLVRAPDGVGQHRYFQKDTPRYAPDWIRTVSIHAESAKRTVRYVLCNDRRTLAWLGNQAAVEFHPSPVRVQRLDRLDLLIFDLDPPRDRYPAVVDVAMVLHEILEELHLPSGVKTTGSKGLHVVVPLQRRFTQDQVRRAGERIAATVVGRAPDLATTEFRIADRGERVLVDIWRNAPSQTAVAPYSPRALPEATVSFPLTWPDLPGARISDFRIGNVQELLDLPGPRAWSQLLTRRARLPTTLTEG